MGSPRREGMVREGFILFKVAFMLDLEGQAEF